MSYTIGCDIFWRALRVRVRLQDSRRPDIVLRSDGMRGWTDARGKRLPQLDGCVDIDVSATPFTNSLPIRRLALRPDESAELSVAYIDVPSMTVQPVRQRYTCLERRADGARYRFEALPHEGLPDGFTADLPVDADGLVLDYPGLFVREREMAS